MGNDLRIKMFEGFGNPREINVNTDTGSIHGILYSDRDDFEAWFMEECAGDEARGFFSMFPDGKLLPIAVMKNLSIESRPWRAIGDELMRSFLREASDAKNVALIADPQISKWYQGWGFTQVGTANGKLVMVLNNY